MRRPIQILIAVLALIWVVRPCGALADARALPPERTEVGGQMTGGQFLDAALAALERGDWTAFHGHAGAVTDPLAAKLLFWLEAVRNDAPVGFAALDAFITANPDWPLRPLLLRRAEEAMPVTMSDASVVGWFGSRRPSTPYGQYRLATALLDLGKKARARSRPDGLARRR